MRTSARRRHLGAPGGWGIHTHTRAYSLTHLHTCTHKCTQIHARAHTHTTHTHTHKHTHTHTHKQMHEDTHIRSYSHAHPYHVGTLRHAFQVDIVSRELVERSQFKLDHEISCLDLEPVTSAGAEADAMVSVWVPRDACVPAVLACVRVRVGACGCVWARVDACGCVRVRLRVLYTSLCRVHGHIRTRTCTRTHAPHPPTHTPTHTHTHTYTCTCTCAHMFRRLAT